MLDAKGLEAARAAYQSAIPDGAWHANGGETDAPIRAAITAYLQAVGTEPAVAVKPLEWTEHAIPPAGECLAYSPVGLYCIPLGHTAFTLRFRDKQEDGPYTTLEAAKAAAEADYASRIRSALEAETGGGEHPDDLAVDRFATAMKAKLKWEREQRNRSGWQAMSAADLSRILYEHLPKGDPVDVANLSMMLHQNGQQIEPPPAEPVVEARTHPLEIYADSYAQMARMGDGKVDCRSVEIDIRQNMIPVTTALATKPAVKDDETVVERSYSLKWTDAPRPPVHPRPIKKQASFPTFDDAVAFMAGRAPDSEFRSLTEYATVYEKFDRTADARAALAAKEGRS